LDLTALTASGKATEYLHAFLVGLREDAAAGLGGGDTTVFHKKEDVLENTANASDLPTVITLANSLKAKLNAHFPSTGVTGVHMIASTETIAAADASDQTTANTLINEFKLDYNNHRTESNVHINDDTVNVVSATAAIDLATSIALVNEVKTDYNAHIVAAMSTPPIEAP
jgi:hypothetical protein